MPEREIRERAGAAVAEPEARAAEPAAEPVAASRSRARSRFDEIVTPHPVVAFLFRRRTFLVLLGVLALVPLARPHPTWLAVGIALATLGECWRIWAAGTIHKTQELTTGGPYAWVRHPLYVGSFLHAVAYCFMSGRWESFVFVPPLFFVLYGAAVSTEEAMLHKLFPEEYAEYSRRVPRFVPRWRRRRGPGGRPDEPGRGRFSWRQVLLNREYINVIWVVVLSALFTLRLFWGR